MSLSKKNDENSKVLNRKIFYHVLCSLVFATLTVVGIFYSGEAVDKFFNNMMHQVYTLIACLSIVVIGWIWWRVRK